MNNDWINSFRYDLIFFLMIIFFCGCSSNHFKNLTENKNNKNLIEVKITKITTFKNYYLIYAVGTKDGRGYKIISALNAKPYDPTSKKVQKKNTIIKVDKNYKLSLVWVSEPDDDKKIGAYMEFKRCIVRHPFVEICTETGFELYESSDIRGLEILISEKNIN